MFCKSTEANLTNVICECSMTHVDLIFVIKISIWLIWSEIFEEKMLGTNAFKMGFIITWEDCPFSAKASILFCCFSCCIEHVEKKIHLGLEWSLCQFVKSPNPLWLHVHICCWLILLLFSNVYGTEWFCSGPKLFYQPRAPLNAI